MKNQTPVYHVANPNVPGYILDENEKTAVIIFDEPVGFSGNPSRGKEKDWICTKSLLFSSPEEALTHQNPNK